MIRSSIVLEREMALDSLCNRAIRAGLIYWWPGRLLVTLRPAYPGDYVRVPIPHDAGSSYNLFGETRWSYEDFKCEIVWCVLDGQRTRLCAYANHPSDLDVFCAMLDAWFWEINRDAVD